MTPAHEKRKASAVELKEQLTFIVPINKGGGRGEDDLTEEWK